MTKVPIRHYVPTEIKQFNKSKILLKSPVIFCFYPHKKITFIMLPKVVNNIKTEIEKNTRTKELYICR